MQIRRLVVVAAIATAAVGIVWALPRLGPSEGLGWFIDELWRSAWGLWDSSDVPAVIAVSAIVTAVWLSIFITAVWSFAAIVLSPIGFITAVIYLFYEEYWDASIAGRNKTKG